MKGKTICAGAAVLLAMAFLGCSEQALDEDAPEYDEQGRRLVTVSIPTRAYEQGGGLRSLTEDIAQAAWDYVEVVFALDSGGYYVGSAVKGNDIHFALPVGDYEAVMFAGVGNGTRLLAVGVATAVDSTPTNADGTLTIAVDTKTITFTLSALETDIATYATRSFEITAPDSPIDYTTPTPIPTCIIDGKETPYFLVPADSQAIEGTFTIGCVGVPDINDLFEYTTSGQLFGIAGDAAAGIDIISSGISAYNQTANISLAPVAVTGTITGAVISSDALVLSFDLETPGTAGLMNGLSKIRFDVPIQAFTLSGSGSFTPSTDRGSVWHIVNGLEAGTLDLGATEQSTGQNILLAVGVDPNGQTIDISGP